MISKELHALIAFSATDLIGYHRLAIIKNKFPHIEDFLELNSKDQMALLGLKSEKSIKILDNMKNNADKIIEICQRKNITFIPYDHISYPKHLKDIEEAPYLLYSQGNLYPEIPMIGVIGTRQSTPEAEEINRWFCKEFAQYGIGVVSGLARGHDAIASQTILQHKGYSIGVLGTAIDTIYPKSSAYLISQMKEQGCIISEYPPGMSATKWRFPRRNRIVSGISQALCVIQAPLKSGTMITVNMATEQHRDVFVVPGNPMIPQNSGTNNLIQNGAKVANHPQDIIRDVLRSNPNLETMQFITENTPTPKVDEQKINAIVQTLSDDEKSIFNLIDSHIHIDEIVRALDMNTAAITSVLTLMELKGVVVQKPGQIYTRGEL